MTKERFYELLGKKFKVEITSENEDVIKIPNTKTLHTFMSKWFETDETIGVRTAKNLYQLYLENKYP